MIDIEALFRNAASCGLLEPGLHVKNGFRYGIKHSRDNINVEDYLKNREYYSSSFAIFIYHKSETFSVKSAIISVNKFEQNSIRPQVDIIMKHFIDNWIKEYPELLV